MPANGSMPIGLGRTVYKQAKDCTRPGTENHSRAADAKHADALATRRTRCNKHRIAVVPALQPRLPGSNKVH
jgi:hypothetical protein